MAFRTSQCTGSQHMLTNIPALPFPQSDACQEGTGLIMPLQYRARDITLQKDGSAKGRRLYFLGSLKQNVAIAPSLICSVSSPRAPPTPPDKTPVEEKPPMTM